MLPPNGTPPRKLAVGGGRQTAIEGPCDNCFKTSPGGGSKGTPRWHERNFSANDEPDMRTLCNACKISYEAFKFCPYCMKIHSHKNPHQQANGEYDKTKPWCPCRASGCMRWAHAACILKAGYDDATSFVCPPWAPGKCPRLCSSRQRDATEAFDRPQTPPSLERGEVASRQFSPAAAGACQARTSPERPPTRVDFRHLKATSLRRYQRLYKIKAEGTDSQALRIAVARHWVETRLPENPQDFLRMFMANLERKRQKARHEQQARQDGRLARESILERPRFRPRLGPV